MEFFSPLQEIVLPGKTKIWIKRDDLIDPYISGNKWRKLKYILKEAGAGQKDHLVTFGGAYSNHLVATAALAARSGLRSTAFVRGEEVNNEMLFLCSLFGMQLIFTDRESYRNKAALFHKFFGTDQRAYFIDEGGAGEAAVTGCEEIIGELPQTFDHIFCAAGTGTTAAGLLKGINQQQLKTRLHVVPVLKGGEFIANEIGKYVKDMSRLQLHTGYHFGGYAKTTPELLRFIENFTAGTGVLVDPVYTGKLFFALSDLFAQDYFKKGERILAIHTGGLLGILGMKTRFEGRDEANGKWK